MKIDARTARLALKLIVAVPALIEAGKAGAAAGRAIIAVLQRQKV